MTEIVKNSNSMTFDLLEPGSNGANSSGAKGGFNALFGGMGAELVAQLLGQPCIADGDLSDCPPEVGILVSGLVG